MKIIRDQTHNKLRVIELVHNENYYIIEDYINDFGKHLIDVYMQTDEGMKDLLHSNDWTIGDAMEWIKL
ncbi:MAG: hypothetical protein KGO96_07220 [Elusimicrobia bacterium]|nr:hypothetical protein [Elusimicrobiota bacterium]